MLNSFDRVAKRYAVTNPLVSRHHRKEDDIRPLGKRTRKWERVAKITRNHYILHDIIASYRDEMGGLRMSGWAAAYEERPAIEWRRRPDGEYVTVRQTVRGEANTSRYRFLEKYLPNGLSFVVPTAGKHTIEARQATGGVKIFHMPRTEADTPHVFKRVGAGWERVNKVYAPPRKRVDKEKKAELKPHLDIFFEWICSAGVMLPTEDWRYASDKARELVVYLRERGIKREHEMVELLKRPENPMRLNLACSFLRHHNPKEVRTDEQRKYFRAAFNRWANREFNLIKTVTE